MATIDASIVIIAMPAIFRGIHLNPLDPGNISYLLWMIIGYLLVQSVLVVTLGTEAEQCIGEDVSYVGQTTVDVEIDPSIPPEDPTQPDLPLPNVQRPPEASPFV